MLDVRKIRQNAQEVRNALKLRSEDLSIDPILSRDEERRQLLAQVEEKKALRNAISKQIGTVSIADIPCSPQGGIQRSHPLPI